MCGAAYDEASAYSKPFVAEEEQMIAVFQRIIALCLWAVIFELFCSGPLGSCSIQQATTSAPVQSRGIICTFRVSLCSGTEYLFLLTSQ